MFEYNNEYYNIIIEKKNIKNMYLRIKDDMSLYITCNRFTTKNQINDFINKNYKSICRMIEQKKKINNNNKDFYYLGKKYEIKFGSYKDIMINNNNIYVKDEKTLNKWLTKQIKNIFLDELNKCINNTEEVIPKNIILRIRKMKTRWGVCNRSNNTITLNSDLIRYEISVLDYVIYHEIAHFTYPNHQKEFWLLVSKYVPNYKEERKKLKY